MMWMGPEMCVCVCGGGGGGPGGGGEGLNLQAFMAGLLQLSHLDAGVIHPTHRLGSVCVPSERAES